MAHICGDVEINAKTLGLLDRFSIIEFEMSNDLEWVLFQKENDLFKNNQKTSYIFPKEEGYWGETFE